METPFLGVAIVIIGDEVTLTTNADVSPNKGFFKHREEEGGAGA
jgi:hypothetical protein